MVVLIYWKAVSNFLLLKPHFSKSVIKIEVVLDFFWKSHSISSLMNSHRNMNVTVEFMAPHSSNYLTHWRLKCFHHIETSQWTCYINQSSGFYIIEVFVLNYLKEMMNWTAFTTHRKSCMTSWRRSSIPILCWVMNTQNLSANQSLQMKSTEHNRPDMTNL